MKNGLGIKFMKNSIYKGEFYKGKKNGIGTYIWSDKSKYKGEWSDNNFNGYGIYYYCNNRIFLGRWKMNIKDGYGIYFTKDIIYIGNYHNHRKEGFGIYYLRKRESGFVGFWKEGNPYGLGKYISNEKSKFGIWSYNKNNAKKQSGLKILKFFITFYLRKV